LKPAVRAGAFTLIEVLVVVAIIALLIAILLPSLKKAREMSRRAVCLSQLHQQGLGMSTYAHDMKGFLPPRGTPKEDFAYVIEGGIKNKPKELTNYGLLYGKYVGEDINIFYCPSLRATTNIFSDPDRGITSFGRIMPGVDPHTTNGGYMWAAPVAPKSAPRNAGRDVYTPNGNNQPGAPWHVAGGIWHANYYGWLVTPVASGGKGYSDTTYMNYRLPGMPAVETEALVLQNSAIIHENGINALYSDFHAKYVVDERFKKMSPSSGSGGKIDLFNVWEILSRRY